VDKIPSYELSKDYADVYLIYPPKIRAKYDPGALESKVQHPTRILTCATEQGIVHITRHISPQVVLLREEHGWTVDQLKGLLLEPLWLTSGWCGQIVCVQKDSSSDRVDENVVWTSWKQDSTFENMLFMDNTR